MTDYQFWLLTSYRLLVLPFPGLSLSKAFFGLLYTMVSAQEEDKNGNTHTSPPHAQGLKAEAQHSQWHHFTLSTFYCPNSVDDPDSEGRKQSQCLKGRKRKTLCKVPRTVLLQQRWQKVCHRADVCFIFF